ncbi:hypothetical protein NA56DRAFT_751350 [Hyaloscypha hepaticicola]|uniref:Uncharacterized protein n=1 Tax=Hyaloscypha hepaticicola TaxID=2082293 RepID=A0A2J6PWS1_9HELO|nr:hypothetical protein NA56DRAFT_751350 [Hyaloscypha hepaticicola]
MAQGRHYFLRDYFVFTYKDWKFTIRDESRLQQLLEKLEGEQKITRDKKLIKLWARVEVMRLIVNYLFNHGSDTTLNMASSDHVKQHGKFFHSSLQNNNRQKRRVYEMIILPRMIAAGMRLLPSPPFAHPFVDPQGQPTFATRRFFVSFFTMLYVVFGPAFISFCK